MAGLYNHTTRSSGTVLTAVIYNADHANHITNHVPAQMDDYSSSVAEMQSTTDPGEVSSESQPTSLAGEIERIRFMLKEDFGRAQWYTTAPSVVRTLLAQTTQADMLDTGLGLPVEEGTWDPDLSDGTNTDATLSNQEGEYTKIGRCVYFWGDIGVSSLGSLSGSVNITGLPFTSALGGSFIAGGISVHFASGLNITAGQVVTAYVRENNTDMALRLWDTATGETAFTASELSADGRLVFSGFYFV